MSQLTRNGLLGCACILLTALPVQSQTGPATPSTEPEINRPAYDDTPSHKLIKNYLTVSGGKQAHIDLQNVVATGQITEAGHIKNFKLIETQDGRRHITYKWTQLGRPYETVLSFDGVITWSQEKLPKEKPAREISGPEANHFKRQRWFIQPFIVPLRAEYVFAYQGAGRVSGRPSHVVVGYGKENERTWFYFDKEKSLLTRWGGLGPIAGIRGNLDYRATRFKKMGGVLLPQAIDLLVEEASFGSIQIDDIRANQKIDPRLFYLPPDTTPTLRQKRIAN